MIVTCLKPDLITFIAPLPDYGALLFLCVSCIADYSDYEDSSLEFLERCCSPLTRAAGPSLALRSMFTEKNTTYQYPRAILSVDLSGESM